MQSLLFNFQVRRAAAKCLEAVIQTRHELLDEFYNTVSPALIGRFKEREENVKADIFHAYVALLKQTKTALLPQLALAAQNNSNDTEMMDLGDECGPANKLMGQVILSCGPKFSRKSKISPKSTVLVTFVLTTPSV